MASKTIASPSPAECMGSIASKIKAPKHHYTSFLNRCWTYIAYQKSHHLSPTVLAIIKVH